MATDLAAGVIPMIGREWDANERVREGRNGRVYVSRGRWVWRVYLGAEVESEHERRIDARRHVAGLRHGGQG